MLVGFVHGVMNTDNTTISGETIDYGPCAFMDVFDPATVFSSIDHPGRYAYGNQPAIAAVEPGASRRDAAASDRREPRCRGGGRDGRADLVRRDLLAALGGGDGREARASPRRTRTWRRTCWSSCARSTSTSPVLPLARGRYRAVPVRRARAVRRLGHPPRGAAACGPGRGGGGHEPGEPRLHPAQPPRRGGADGGHRRRPGAVPPARGHRLRSVRAAARPGRLRRPAPAGCAPYVTYCGT